MLKRYKILRYCFFIFLVSQSSTTAQFIRQDDFQYKNDYWYWRADGNQSIPSIENGLLHLKLQDAVSDQYCNTEIYDPTEPYQPGTQVRVRLKCSNIHHGSRGWGFWDGDLDLTSVFFDFDVAWVMQQGSDNPDSAYNWFHFGVDGNLLTNRHTLNLQNLVDETEWHTYKIIWDTNNVAFYTDDGLLYQIYDDLPDEAMRMDIWIDNRVINIDNPLTFWNNNVETSEMFVDFLEISGVRGPSILRSTHDNIILWESPNTFPNGKKESLWQQYSFNTNSTGEALIYLTGSAETYGTIMDDDNLKIVVDNNDYGWNTPNSLNGNELNGKGKSIVLPVMLNAGNHNLDIYSDITPFLRDVLVVYSENSKVIYSNNYNETASGTDSLWKTVEFNTEDSTSLTIIVSGTGYENDGIRIELDNKDYGWQGENCIDGNALKGIPATIVINEILEGGSHSLKIFSKGTPQLYSLALYGKSTVDTSTVLVELTSFTASAQGNFISFKWLTATEVNNYGFDIERSQTANVKLETWEKIGFVNGNGNSSSPKEYTFSDKSVTCGKYSYRLKQIDYDGKYEYSKIVEVDLGLPKTFNLGQNYPNPFNPSTTINFSLPKQSNVNLRVFDLLGEEIISLVNNELKPAGSYSFKFDASSLASGTYIYRLEAGDFVQTKKMTLTK